VLITGLRSQLDKALTCLEKSGHLEGDRSNYRIVGTNLNNPASAPNAPNASNAPNAASASNAANAANVAKATNFGNVRNERNNC